MIRNKEVKFSFSLSFLVATFFHLVILLFVKKSTLNLSRLSINEFNESRKIKVDKIELIKPEELAELRKVGIKNGALILKCYDESFH
jgi:hypothetical protein